MLRRFFLGLIEGLVIGLGVAVASARGLGLSTPDRVTATLLAAAVGFLVGLVAGRPVWARDAKTEALLKASVGALVGAGASLGLAHLLHAPVDLSSFELGVGPVGNLLAVSLPAIACALSLFFELDDTGSVAPNLSAPRPSGVMRLRPTSAKAVRSPQADGSSRRTSP